MVGSEENGYNTITDIWPQMEIIFKPWKEYRTVKNKKHSDSFLLMHNQELGPVVDKQFDEVTAKIIDLKAAVFQLQLDIQLMEWSINACWIIECLS